MSVHGNTSQDEPALAAPVGADEPRCSASPVPRWTAWDLPESLAVFAIGAALMSFIYAGSAGDVVGVPGHDSFYHIKMASLIPEHGLLDRFPWLKFTWFVEEGDAFVSHHYGFHLLLLPFVTISHWLTGDYLFGARWAIATTFGTTVMLLNLLLITGRVRWRWLWLFFFLLMPFQFFTRHAFIRAISPSLMFMLLIALLMFRRHYKLTGLAVLAYMHLYLGGVIYAPLLVGLYVLASIVGPRGDREFPLRLILWTAGAWVVGVLIHPYSGGMLEFLELQVFGSGLSPDISVGREWKPYKGVWWFAQMSGNILLLWSIAVCLRFRLGSRLSAQELFFLLAHFAFLLLTFKARRFVEYWPVFCLLSAAFLAGPLIRQLTCWSEHTRESAASHRAGWLWGSTVVLTLACGALCYGASQRSGINGFLLEWQVWAILTAMYLFVPLGRIWLASAAPVGEPSFLLRSLKTVRVMVLGVAFLAATACFVGPQLVEIQRTARCGYDLPAIERAMSFLAENSEPGDVVFTDDWDIFPVYFYYNSHNHYIVGLDPKFTHARRPDLWERYVKVSRGQVPADVTVEMPGPTSARKQERIHIALEDIRDHFGARFVVTDDDHKPLAAKLADAEDFAELIYPSTDHDKVRDEPYLVFRVRDEGEPRPPKSEQPRETPNEIYLSSLTPLSMQQGWGDFVADVSVGGGAIHVGDREYARGLGTHTPSKLLYAIPQGYDAFRATVGINRSTDGQGSTVVSASLDDEVVFTSSVLTGTSEPAVVHIPLGGAKRLLLEAHPTDDGKRHDHVDWADARFVRETH